MCTPEKEKKSLPMMSLNKDSKLLPQQKREMESTGIDILYKSIDSIYCDLITLFKNSPSEEEFQCTEFVARATNDIVFMARRNEEYPTRFEMEPGNVLHVCIHQHSEHCQLFKILERKSNTRPPL